jgi:Flp pilus assembly protein TadG
MAHMREASSASPRLIRRLHRDERGVTAIVTALGLVVLMGFAGLAVDVGAWLAALRGLQSAADQGAYSAAGAAGQNGCSSTTATSQATAIVAAHGYINGQSGVTVAISCNSSNSTFKVTVSQLQPMWFTHLFLSTAPTASASATAQLAGQVSDMCILALDGLHYDYSGGQYAAGVDPDAADLTGNVSLDVNCGIAVDSSNTQAFGVGGSAVVSVTDVYLVGDDQGTPSGHGSLTTKNAAYSSPVNGKSCYSGGACLANQIPVEDPYSTTRTMSTLANSPVNGGSCTFVPNPVKSVTNSGTTLNPGTYCGGLTLGSNGSGHNVNITLTSGTYYIVGGTLTINASANVTANGVTFVLTGNNSLAPGAGYATVKINGGAALSLIAPTTGPTAGMALWQDAGAPFASNATCGNGNAQNKINGGSLQLITGAIYFPNQSVCYNGNSSTTLGAAGSCTQLIARTLDFTGNSKIRGDNTSCGGTGITAISIPTPKLIN